MSIKTAETLHERACLILDELSRKERLSWEDWKSVDLLAHTCKSLERMIEYEEEAGEGGSSQRGYSRGSRGSYNGASFAAYNSGNSYGGYGGYDGYDGGTSERRGHYVKGHYSRDDGQKYIADEMERSMIGEMDEGRMDAMRRMRDGMRG